MSYWDNLYQITMLRDTITYLYRYVLPVAYILGNIGNFISFLVFLQKPWKKNVCVFYFKICLLSNTGFINSYMLAPMLKYTFQIIPQDSNVILCKLYFYAFFLFFSISPTVLICASVDRLLISSQNVDTRLYSSKRLAYFSTSISVTFWVLFYIHLLVYVNIQEMYPTYFICYINLSPSYVNFVAYSLQILNVTICVLMIILCVLSFKNVRRIRAVPREQRRQQIRTMTKRDFQLLRCLFTQDVIFISCSVSICILNVYRAITLTQTRTDLEWAFMDFSNDFFTFICYIPYWSNFFVFIIVSKTVRHELKRMIYNIIGKTVNPIQEDENKNENIEQNNVELNVVSNIVLHS